MSIPPMRERLLMPNLLAANAEQDAHKIAVRFGDAALNYAELAARANRLAQSLVALGVGHGDRVGILLANRLEYLETYYGIALAGAVCVPMLPRLSPVEIAYQLGDSGARAVIVERAHVPLLSEVGIPHGRWLVLDHDGGDGVDYEASLSAAPAEAPALDLREDDLYCIRYTSGTTGRPKGSANSQRSWWLTAMSNAVEWRIGPDDVTLANGPMSHVSGMLSHAHVAVGASIVGHERFDPVRTVTALEEDGITNLFMVPTQYAMVLDHLGGRAVASQTLRTLLSTAAPMSAAVKARIGEAFPGAGLHESYAATETPMVSNLRPSEQLDKPDSVGRPRFFGTKVRLLDADGAEVPQGEVGEIWVSNPMVHRGYHERPEATAAATRDGFVAVGDLGRFDEDGYLYIVGRKADMIISGGLNVYPLEVEYALIEHPAVANAAVFGVPDERWGERVCAALIPAEGEPLDVDEVYTWARTRLADYKTPRAYAVVAEFPVSGSGKLLRRELVQGLLDADRLITASRRLAGQA